MNKHNNSSRDISPEIQEITNCKVYGIKSKSETCANNIALFKFISTGFHNSANTVKFTTEKVN